MRMSLAAAAAAFGSLAVIDWGAGVDPLDAARLEDEGSLPFGGAVVWPGTGGGAVAGTVPFVAVRKVWSAPCDLEAL